MNLLRALARWLRDWWRKRRRKRPNLHVVPSLFETIAEAERRPS